MIQDAEGYLHLVGRAKDIIIRGGENISAAEVEEAFYTHPSIFECGAVGIPDKRLGERVGMLVVLKRGHTATGAELRGYLCSTRKLAKFKIPEANDIVMQKDKLPRGATGKILKRTIRKIMAERLSDMLGQSPPAVPAARAKL